MGTQDQGGGLRRRKGWIGYALGWKEYMRKVDYTKIKWDDKSLCKEEYKDKMGKTIQKW